MIPEKDYPNQSKKITLLLLAALLAFCLPVKLLAQKPSLIIPATHSARSVIISPNDQWLISAGHDGFKIWDNKKGALLKNFAPGNKNTGRFNNGAIAMAIDDNSRYTAMQVEDTLYIFDLDEFEIAKRIKLDVVIQSMCFSANAQVLFIAGIQAESIDVYQVQQVQWAQAAISSVQQIAIKTLATHEASRLCLSPDDKQLLLYDQVMGSWLIDIQSRSIKKYFSDKMYLYPFGFAASGNLLAMAGEKEKIMYVQELNAKTYLPMRRSKTLFKNINNINACNYSIVYPSLSGKTGLLYQNEFMVFDDKTFTATAKKELPQGDKIGWLTRQSMTLAPNGNYYINGIEMTRNNCLTNEVISRLGEFPLDAYVQFVFKHIDGVCLKDRTLSFENGVFNMRLVPPISSNAKIDYADFIYRLTKDGKTGFLYNQQYGLFRFDPTRAKIEYESISKINALNKNFVGMQVFDDQRVLALTGNEGIYVLDITTLKLLYIVDIPMGLEYYTYEQLDKYCDIAPDNSKMILYAHEKEGEGAVISCVGLTDKNEKWQYKANRIQNLRFTDGGKKILFTTKEKLIYLDAETGKESSEAVALPAASANAFITPSGKLIATKIPVDTLVYRGMDIGLVDVLNKSAAGFIKGTGDDVSDYVFVKNERYMLSEEDGGLCFWDLEKKRQIGKLYMFEQTADWVLLAPDGRFDATEGAMKKMYFTRGKEIIPLESLYEKYFVPGLLKQVWDNTLVDAVPDINTIKTPPVVKISLQAGQRNLVVTDDVPVIKTDAEQVTIKAEAQGLSDVITEIRLYQNGKLVHSTRNLVVEDENKGEQSLTKSFLVTLSAGENTFKAVAINSQRTESVPAELVAVYTPANILPKPVVPDIQLHVMIIGINAYKNPKYNLNYAQADAEAFAASLKAGAAGLFAAVNVQYLKDSDASKEGISKAFEQVKTVTRAQDLFVFYYAGHGVINDQKEFFLVPYDVTQLYGNDDALLQKGFSAAALQQMSKDIKAQKQLFILDACQSAGALTTIAAARGAAEEKAIAQLARSTGTQWLTASGSEQFASEFAQLGHGSFTYCLLQAFKGDADQGDKKLTVKELDAYLQAKVPEVTQQYKGTPQYPASYSYGNDFPIIIIK
ncbi:MAG: hypothetical protein RL172_2792 [Bacteroidota bacterium]